jgi:hypothetical protein
LKPILRRITVTLAACAVLSIVSFAQTSNFTRVKFPRGRTTAILKGTLSPDMPRHYALKARAGQTMTVHLASPGKNARFTIYPSGQAHPLDDAKDRLDWSGELPDSGEYVITVMPVKGRASYTLEVTIR